jgi:hypothetical protein
VTVTVADPENASHYIAVRGASGTATIPYCGIVGVELD